jgi:hypothetical protein
MTQITKFSDNELRLLEMGGSFIAIDRDGVNIDDLLRAGRRDGGGIVRCYGNPNDVIRVVQIDSGPVGCVAGWISEDDQ